MDRRCITIHGTIATIRFNFFFFIYIVFSRKSINLPFWFDQNKKKIMIREKFKNIESFG